jgi:hypothetical protein
MLGSFQRDTLIVTVDYASHHEPSLSYMLTECDLQCMRFRSSYSGTVMLIDTNEDN